MTKWDNYTNFSVKDITTALLSLNVISVFLSANKTQQLESTEDTRDPSITLKFPNP